MNNNINIKQDFLPAEMQEFIKLYSTLYVDIYRKQHSEKTKKGIAFKKNQNTKNNKITGGTMI